MTMAEMEIVQWEGEFASTMKAKNLFLADKKNKARTWVVCATTDAAIDMKALTKALGVGSGNLRGGSEEAMFEKLGARKGGLNLFSIINDANNDVKLILDKRLAEDHAYVGFHPMTNEATTAISREDMMKLIQLAQHEPTIMDFEAMGTAAPAGGAPAPKQKPQKQQKQAKQDGGEGGKKGKGKKGEQAQAAKQAAADAD